MSQMAYMQAVWSGQQASSGIARTRGELGSLGTAARGLNAVFAELGPTLGGVFSLTGPMSKIAGALIFLRQGIADTEAWDSAAQKTTDTLTNLGYQGSRAFESVAEAAARVADSTAFGDDELLAAANALIEGTEDLAGSLRNLSLVADLAAARNMDLGSSAQVVAKIMEGNNRAVGQMLPFMRSYAESLDSIADPAARAALMLERLTRSLSGKAAAELETGKGIWKELVDAFGNAAGGLAELTRINDLWNQSLIGTTNILKTLTPGTKEQAHFWKDLVANMNAVRNTPGDIFRDMAPNNWQGPAHMGDLRQADRALDTRPLPVLGPGNDEGIARFQQVVEEWSRVADKWAFAADPKFPRANTTQRGPVREMRLAGDGIRVQQLDEDLIDPGRQKARELGQLVQQSISSAIVAGGNAGWSGFLDSLKQTGLGLFADLVGGVFMNLLAPGTGGGGFLGGLLNIGEWFGMSAASGDNLARRGAR